MNAQQLGRPRFVTTDEALGWHAIAIAEYGGSSGLRDAGALDSALAMARQCVGVEYVHAYPFGMAAAYAFHVAKNHPFVDGNKRAALLCCGSFLRMNGWDLVSVGTEAAEAIVALVEGRLDKDGFAEWLKVHSRARPSLELRDFFALLTYGKIAEMLSSGLADADEGRARTERVATMLEAAKFIPAITEANLGAIQAEEAGQREHARTLRSQSLLLTAIHRIAEDMGYEW